MKRTVDEARRERRISRALFLGVWLFLLIAWLWFGSKAFLAVLLTMTALVPLSFFLQCAAAKRLALSVQAPTLPVQKDQPIPFGIKLQNNAVLPLSRLSLTVTLRNEFTGESEPLVLSGCAAPKKSAEIDFESSAAHCGYLQAEITGVTVCDLFGFLTKTKKPPRPVFAGAAVFPDVYEVTVAVSPSVAEGFAQSEQLAAKKGTDLSQGVSLRAFEPGDTLRQVHWKLTEKTGEWITREGTEDGRSSLLLFWDPSGSEQAPALADALADAVASVGYALLDSGVPFRFAWTLSDDAAFAAPVAEQELNTRILEAVRRPTGSQPAPNALFDGSRVLHFSIHQPMETTDSFTCLSCDDGGLSPQRPLRELIV